MRGAVGKAGAYWNGVGTRLERRPFQRFHNELNVDAPRVCRLFQHGTVPEAWNEKTESGTGTAQRLARQGFSRFFGGWNEMEREHPPPPLKGVVWVGAPASGFAEGWQ